MKNKKEKPEKQERIAKPLWETYRVRWDFITSLCSSVPANPDLIKAWLEARAPKVRPPNAKSIATIQEEVFNSIADPEDPDEIVAKNMLVFQRNEGVLVMRAGTVRAHLKDCSRIISAEHVGTIKGERSFAHHLVNCTYLDEKQYWLPILSQETGKPFTKPDGIREKAIHLRGRGNALKAFEFVHGARLEFTLKVLSGNVHKEDLETVFQYGGVHGYAGERGDGEGQYTYTFLDPI
jgi:hypothetical protein